MDNINRIKFFKTPKSGDIVKVYYGVDGIFGIRYGKVVYIETINYFDEFTKMDTYRDIAVLESCDKIYDLHELQFCLPELKIKFINDTDFFKNNEE